MGILSDVVDAAIKLGKFIIGDKSEPKLEEPIGELEVEKRKRELEEARRMRRGHGGK
jgi:hypothetical protein